MKNSAIQWTDHTFNPWEGCAKVAPECKNCYAETLVDHRFGRAKWGKGQPRRRTSENLWKQPPNVWIGVSAGADQKAALEIPAKVHFLSCEPMLHALDEEENHVTQEFDWIIFGGESGKNARPCNVDWIRGGVEMCRFYDIAPFVKQLGAQPIMGDVRPVFRDSHGGDMSEWPEDLRVREFPTVREAVTA